MKQYTDEQAKNWMERQIAMFKGQASGFGWEAIQAQSKLKAIEQLPDSEKLRIAHLNLETIQQEGQYTSQLPA